MSSTLTGGEDTFTTELKSIAKKNLVKHLEGRILNMNTIKSWGEMILNDLAIDIKNKYPDFCFGLFFFICDKTNYFTSHSQSIQYTNTDRNIVETYDTNEFNSEVRIFANKKYSPKVNFKDNMPSNYIVRINKRFHDSLEGRKYISGQISNYCQSIVNDINNILLERKNRPCSFHICFIHQLPMKNAYIDFKFIDVDYMPFFFSYSNDSLCSNLYLFVFNN